MTIATYEEFLSLFPEHPREQAGQGVLVLCPAHNDHKPSLWVKPSDNPDFIATWDCMAGSCSREDVLKSKHLTWDDVRTKGYKSNKNRGGALENGKPCQPVNGMVKQPQIEVDTPMSTGVNGLTLADLAKAKHLPVDYLKSLGISDFKYSGLPSIKIPYYSEDGQEIAVRYRLALSGDCRFKWRKGDHAVPYGLNKLELARKSGWILVVEGESDCWTAWYNKIPAIGAPGKSIWPVAWGEYLKGLEVYVWQEPEAQDFILRVLESAPGLRYIAAPDGIKDISEAHIQGIPLSEWSEELKRKAESGQALKQRSTNAQIAETYKAAKPIIEAADPLELIQDAVRKMGYGGDLRPVLITYLAAASRLLEMRPGAMPVHLLLIGPPSAGKSYTVGQVLKLLPLEAYHTIDAGSPRAIIYDTSDLQHKVLIFSEADSLPAGEDNPAASAIRGLLQDHYLHYTVTVRDPETGQFMVKEIDKPGPTVMITTSTKSLGAQLMTRVFSLEVSDSEEQIKAALETQAMLETEGARSPDASLIAFQFYLQLKAPIKVSIPYARELSRALGKMASAPRMLRDFARLLSLIKSVALICQHHRLIDHQGRIVATLEDYQIVRGLINDMYIDSSTGITSDVRNLVEAIIRLNARQADGEKINNTTLATELKTGVKQVTRRAAKAMKMGWIVNREQRKSYPADYAPGEPMPDVEGLPLADGLTGLTSGMSTVFEAKNGEVDRLTPLTDAETLPLTMDAGIPTVDTLDPLPDQCRVCGARQFRGLPVDGKWICINGHLAEAITSN